MKGWPLILLLALITASGSVRQNTDMKSDGPEWSPTCNVCQMKAEEVLKQDGIYFHIRNGEKHNDYCNARMFAAHAAMTDKRFMTKMMQKLSLLGCECCYGKYYATDYYAWLNRDNRSFHCNQVYQSPVNEGWQKTHPFWCAMRTLPQKEHQSVHMITDRGRKNKVYFEFPHTQKQPDLPESCLTKRIPDLDPKDVEALSLFSDKERAMIKRKLLNMRMNPPSNLDNSTTCKKDGDCNRTKHSICFKGASNRCI